MHGYLKQSTASQSRVIGPFLDDTDFKTEETGLTIANTDIKLRANGTTLSNKASGGGTHQANGCYSLTWDATDTANVGELFFTVKVAGALPVFGTYVVLEEAVYDALFAASAPGYLQPTTAARTLDVTATGAAGIDWGNIENPTTAVNLSATNIDVDQVVASVTGAVGSVTGAVGSVTGSVGSVASGGITAASIAADAITAAKVADGTIDAATFAAGAINAAAIATDAITAAKIATDAIGASELATDAVTEIVTAVFARAFSAAYGSYTFDQLTSMIAAVLLAKCSGMATTTGTFRNLADSADVIVATQDANGNRTAITRTP